MVTHQPVGHLTSSLLRIPHRQITALPSPEACVQWHRPGEEPRNRQCFISWLPYLSALVILL